MKAKDAAIQVLRETSGPLRAEEIAERMLSEGLWETTGKTPAATVAAILAKPLILCKFPQAVPPL